MNTNATYVQVTYVQTHPNGDKELCRAKIQFPDDVGIITNDMVFDRVCRLTGRLGWTPIRAGMTWATIFGT